MHTSLKWSEKKLDKKTIKLRFLGYSDNQKGYRLFDIENRKVIVRRDVIFNESDFGSQKQKVDLKLEAEVEAELGESSQSPDVLEEEDSVAEEVQQQEPRRSQRAAKGQPPLRFGFDEYADVTHVALHTAVEEPATMQEALSSKYSAQWKAAADCEYQSLMENKTWELVELPTNRKTIGSKWVFKVKYGKHGEVDRFKGRLVAKGYSQKYGVDYDETFSPVLRFSSLRILLAYAVQKKMLVHQMDVTTAFLNGDLEEEIYMEQPEGYVVSGKEHMVCKLKKSLYGLKQSPRCWNRAFRESMESQNFIQSQADPCIFVKRSSDGSKLTIVAVYVYDLIIITIAKEEMKQIKSYLSNHFQMKDLRSLHFFLGISIEQNEEGMKLCQKQYIEKLLERYRLQDANPVTTPMD